MMRIKLTRASCFTVSKEFAVFDKTDVALHVVEETKVSSQFTVIEF